MKRCLHFKFVSAFALIGMLALAQSALAAPVELKTPVGVRLSGTTVQISGVGEAPYTNNWPEAEGPEKAFDGSQDTKYLNFVGSNAGLIFSPYNSIYAGRLTTLNFFTANDEEGRDPTSYILYGSSVDLYNKGPGTTYSTTDMTLIASGTVNLPSARKQAGGVGFINENVYKSYLVVFPTIKNGDTGMTQISGLLGFFTPMVKIDKSSLIFRAEYGNGSSDVQSFNVSTLGILPENPIVTAPPNFEVSLNNVNFSDSLGILKNTEQTVYVRLKATAPYGEYNGTLRIWTYNSVTVEQTVSLSGVVMKAAQPSVSSLPSFTTAYPDGSNSQSFTLSSYGLNMPTTITAPANFEVSLNNVNFLALRQIC